MLYEKIDLFGRTFELRPGARVKRFSAVLDTHGQYYLRCPPGFTVSDLTDEHIELIRKLVMKTASKTATLPPPKEYRDGELFYFKGKQYPLRISSTVMNPPIEFSGGAFSISADKRQFGYELFEFIYKRLLYDELRTILPNLAKNMGVNPAEIRIKTTKSLWGSCNKRGAITFCTNLILAPPELLEYVAVHEFAHLKEMNHSPAFWSVVAEFVPDFKRRRRELKENSFMYRWW